MVPSSEIALLVYDGDCGFCSMSAKWIATRWKQPASARAIPSQQLDRAQLNLLGLSEHDVATRAWWIDGARRSGGHLAVARGLIAARGSCGVLGRILLIPPVRQIAALGYRLVA